MTRVPQLWGVWASSSAQVRRVLWCGALQRMIGFDSGEGAGWSGQVWASVVWLNQELHESWGPGGG